MLDYSQDLDESQDFAARSMARMKQLGIPTSARNFAVWYTYFSGSNPDLKRMIDVLHDNHQPFTDVRCLELYDRFFGFGREGAALQDAGSKIGTAVSRVFELVNQAGGDANRYGASLAGLSGDLKASRAAGQVRSIIQRIVSETDRMQEQAQRLEKQLLESSQEITLLRQDLEVSRRDAMTDSLTGIANRKYFETKLRELAKQAMEDGSPISLLLADIDHFKRFNDSYGHQRGDKVLKLVARGLTDNIKGRDLAARYGGEEFAILLPRTNLVNAGTVAEHIRKSVANKRIVKKSTGETLGNITLSIGVAQYRPGEVLSQLVRRADEALYTAKCQGRDRVIPEDRIETVLAAVG